MDVYRSGWFVLAVVLLAAACLVPTATGGDPPLVPIFPDNVTDLNGNTAGNDSRIIWASLPADGGSTSEPPSAPDTPGIRPLANLAKGFVDTVQPNDFPYGK